jgi:prolyl oligopeptidase
LCRPTIYRLDTADRQARGLFQPKIPFDSSQYELKQVFFKSKDGTQVPMFIAGKKGLKMDGTERLLMTGYGGFNLSETPDLEPASPGGSSRADGSRCPTCAAAASMARPGTSRDVREEAERLRRLVCGRRIPDRQQVHLAAALRHYRPLQWRPADGRVHHAAAGAVLGGLVRLSAAGHAALSEVQSRLYWTTEYGSAENEKQFPYLLKYSPYQNVKPGTAIRR